MSRSAQDRAAPAGWSSLRSSFAARLSRSCDTSTVRLALPLLAIVVLGVVIVVGSGWGGLWLYGFGVSMSLGVVVLIAYGGPAIEALGRAHHLGAHLTRTHVRR